MPEIFPVVRLVQTGLALHASLRFEPERQFGLIGLYPYDSAFCDSLTAELIFIIRIIRSLMIAAKPISGPLLKWVGSKYRFAPAIVQQFPEFTGRYFEPFVGSGAVFGHLRPSAAVLSDTLSPLMEIWKTAQVDCELVTEWYSVRWSLISKLGKLEAYEKVKASFNAHPNGADLLFLSRSCWGGVVRFRKDGFMSTPVGTHQPITPEKFRLKAEEWSSFLKAAEVKCLDYSEAISTAGKGDLVYCDPPYVASQSILYGSQKFSLEGLFQSLVKARSRGAFVALSIDGTKQTNGQKLKLDVPSGLFERELLVGSTRSMLLRFQKAGQSLEGNEVSDRLLMSW